MLVFICSASFHWSGEGGTVSLALCGLWEVASPITVSLTIDLGP